MTIEAVTKQCLNRYLGKHSNQNSQAGFAMPLALGIGLVMIIVVASTIGRSYSDRVTTDFQQKSNRALNVAETGVVRVQSFLDSNKFLATKNLDNWATTIDTLPSLQSGCHLINYSQTSQQVRALATGGWIAIDRTDSNKGRYRVVDYQYQNGVGKLTIDSEIDADNTTQLSSSSRLKVEMPIGSEAANLAPPALWANTFNLSSSQKITGQIRAVTCPQLPAIDPDGVNGLDRNNIMLTTGLSSGQIIADPFVPMPAPKVAPNTAILLPAIIGSIQLPRVGFSDVPDRNNEYHYLVDLDGLSSRYSIKLQDRDRITIAVLPNQKINLYLKGNIDLAGSQTIGVDRTHPNLRIYGSNQTTRFSIKNTASITAFIHAPLAIAQSIATMPSNPSGAINGAIWVNSWDSNTSPNNLPIFQSGNWSDFGIAKVEQPPQLSPIASWQRLEN